MDKAIKLTLSDSEIMTTIDDFLAIVKDMPEPIEFSVKEQIKFGGINEWFVRANYTKQFADEDYDVTEQYDQYECNGWIFRNIVECKSYRTWNGFKKAIIKFYGGQNNVKV